VLFTLAAHGETVGSTLKNIALYVLRLSRSLIDFLEEFEDAYSTAKQSALALFVNLGNLLAGLSINSAFRSLKGHPRVFRVYPQVLGTRGILTGIFSARTSTGLHLGSIGTNLRGNTKYFYSMVSTMLVLASLSAFIISFLFFLSSFSTSVEVYAVICTTIAAVSPFSLAVISIVAFQVFKKKLDPDILLYPTSSVLNDIVISLVFIEIARLAILGHGVFFVITASLLSAFFIALGFYTLLRGEKEVLLSTLREGGLALLIGLTIELGTGLILSRLLEVGGVAKIAILYPVMLSTLGGSISIVGSMLTTRLSTGEFDFSTYSFKQFGQNIIGLQMASLVFHSSLSFIASYLMREVTPLEFFTLSYLSHLLGFTIMMPIVFLTVYVTNRKGLDPDNFVNPIESSIADFVETVSILVVYRTLGAD